MSSAALGSGRRLLIVRAIEDGASKDPSPYTVRSTHISRPQPPDPRHALIAKRFVDDLHLGLVSVATFGDNSAIISGSTSSRPSHSTFANESGVRVKRWIAPTAWPRVTATAAIASGSFNSLACTKACAAFHSMDHVAHVANTASI